MTKLGRPVVIEFRDHSTLNAQAMVPMQCEVIGWLVREDKVAYCLATWVSDGLLEDPNTEGFVILKSAITKMRRL